MYAENSTMEKFAEVVRTRMFEKLPDSKVKLTTVFGRHFWRHLDAEEFDRAYQNAWVLIDDVHTKEELIEVAKNFHRTKFDLYN